METYQTQLMNLINYTWKKYMYINSNNFFCSKLALYMN